MIVKDKRIKQLYINRKTNVAYLIKTLLEIINRHDFIVIDIYSTQEKPGVALVPRALHVENKSKGD